MQISAEKKKMLWFAYFVSLICWAINSFGLLALWAASGKLFALLIDGRPYISDFVNHYDAGILALKGKSVRIYDFNLQASLARQTIAPIIPELPFYLQAPPTLFICCIPLAFFSITWAWVLFCFVGVTLCVLSVLALIKSKPEFQSKFSRAFVLAAVFASFPTWIGIRLGSTSLFLLPALTLFFTLLRQKRYFAAGLATAALMVKVQYLPFIGLIGLVLGRGRYLLGAAIAAIVFAAVSVLVLGWDNVVDWPHILLSAETTVKFSGVEPENMQNIRGIMVALCDYNDTSFGRMVALVLFIVGTIATGLLWLKPYAELGKRSAWSFEICAGLSTLMMVIFSVHTHIQDYLLMTISGIYLYSACAEPGKKQQSIEGSVSEDSSVEAPSKEHSGDESDSKTIASSEPEGAAFENSEVIKSNMLGTNEQIVRLSFLLFPVLSWLFFEGKFPLRLIHVQPFAVFAILLSVLIYYNWFVKKPNSTEPKSKLA